MSEDEGNSRVFCNFCKNLLGSYSGHECGIKDKFCDKCNKLYSGSKSRHKCNRNGQEGHSSRNEFCPLCRCLYTYGSRHSCENQASNDSNGE